MRNFCTSICLFFIAQSTQTSYADCKAVLVDSDAEPAKQMRVMGASGHLSRLVTVPSGGKIHRVIGSPDHKSFYFTEIDTARISSSKVDGSDYQVISTRTLPPIAIAIFQGRLYWTEDTAVTTDIGQGNIISAQLDGTDAQTILTGLTTPNGLAFGPNGRMYWTDAADGAGYVYSALPNGSDLQEVLRVRDHYPSGYDGYDSLPLDLAIDQTGSQLLISEEQRQDGWVFYGRSIWQSDLTGGNFVRHVNSIGSCGSAFCTLKNSSMAINPSARTVNVASYSSQAFGAHIYTSNIILGYDLDDTSAYYEILADVSGTGLAFFKPEDGICHTSGNLLGSNHANPSVYRPSTGTWYERDNGTDAAAVRQWGLSGDIPFFANFTGDAFADLVVWRKTEGNWYLCDWDGTGGCASTEVQQWGLPGDFPIAGDFDGDGLTDLTVWRPSEGNWYIKRTLFPLIQQWGLPGDLPFAADFNNDSRDDYVVWRPGNGTWYVLYSSYQGAFPYIGDTFIRQWGLPGDKPLIADYDGDGRPDLAVWRPSSGNWYICSSSSDYDCLGSGGSVSQFGLPGDSPIAGDFDGDGKAEPAVWRPSTGTWYYHDTNGNAVSQQWGLPGDIPVGQ